MRLGGTGISERWVVAPLVALAFLLLITASAQAAKPTVVLVRAEKSGISEGTSATVDAQCPKGYDVLGGSVFIDGNSAFAHRTETAPLVKSHMFRAVITNPLVNDFAGIPESTASVQIGAECAVSGRPVVVDGAFPSASSLKPGKSRGTVKQVLETQTGIDNGSVTNTTAKCPSGTSIFGGGFALGGSPWTHMSDASVASVLNGWYGGIVYPPFDPALGILRRSASMRVLALCAATGQPLVLSSGASVQGSSEGPVASRGPRRAAPKRSDSTIVLVKETQGGIDSGEVRTVRAKCPNGYSVFTGSYSISDSAIAIATTEGVLSKLNSFETTVTNPPPDINGGLPKTTASVTVGAVCARSGVPIVLDTPFPS